MRGLIAGFALALAGPLAAQVPVAPSPYVAPSTDFIEIPALQVDLVLKAGSDRVYFSGNDFGLTVSARATLAAQARWLLVNPEVRALIEGHSDQRDTREHALAIGERRATTVRDYLVSLGVPPVRLNVTSWGKERPIQPAPGDYGIDRNARVVTTIIR
ncbi:MAG: OmpA family protein [Sphingomicrobium sp.]